MPNVIRRVLKKKKEAGEESRLEDDGTLKTDIESAVLMALMIEEREHEPRMRAASRNLKGRRNRFPFIASRKE